MKLELQNKLKKVWAVAVVTALAANSAMADGVTGINAANTSLRQYVDPVCALILVAGGVVGVIGGIRVFNKWNSGAVRVDSWFLFLLLSKLFLVYHNGEAILNI